MLKVLSISAVWYEDGDRLGMAMAYLSLLPILIFTSETVLALTTMPPHSQAYQGLLMGQLLNELVSQLAKNVLRCRRPESSPMQTDYGMPSSHAQFIGFFWGAWPVGGAAGKLPGVCSVVSPRAIRLVSVLGGFLVCYSRIYLRYHSWEQVLVGLLVGWLFGWAYRRTMRLG